MFFLSCVSFLSQLTFFSFRSLKIFILNFRFLYSRIVHMDHETGESLDSVPSDNVSCEHGDFECNICFEIAQDPIVTLCGHLYCWPCLCEWLQVHSHSHECPVCKALIEDQKLVPIYGRGKTTSDPRSHIRPRMNIPNRPVFGPRPQTAPTLDMNYFRPDELDQMGGFMPMASARFGNLTLSTLFGAIPSFFNLHVQGFHDATVYGATTGVPYLFSSSLHGGYAHGFHHSIHVDGTKFFIKMFLLIIGFLLVVSLIL